MGDFNGHLQALDGFQDFNGDLVDLTARDLNLEIANLRDDCEGEFTWCARNSRSCIDYVLMSPKLSRHVTSVAIDEDGKFSVGSDHNGMKLTFSTSTWRQKRRDRREPTARYLPEETYENIAQEFEGRLMNLEGASKAMVGQGGPGGTNCSTRGESPTQKSELWQRYLDCKRDMQAIVQRKIAEHNGEQLKAIIEDKRKGSRRFWTYVSSLDRRAAMPQIRNEETDLPISDLSEHLTEHMHRLYQPVQPACVAAESNEAEIHYPEGEIMKWQVTRGAVDRAIARIDAHTAKGLDGIPAGVVKHLGDAARDHLADIFSGIIAGDSVPTAWRTGRVCLRMAEVGMSEVWVGLIRRLYKDNSAIACFDGAQSRPVMVTRGLKQGCPLSPLLYMIYVSGLEQTLLASSIGFSFTHLYGGTPVTWKLPGLVYADDLVLLAESPTDLQQLVTLAATHLYHLDLTFNAKKSAALQLSGSPPGADIYLPGGDQIQWDTEYRSSQRAANVLRRKSLWGCNRFLLTRDLWKAVHVPGLTFANAVLCLNVTTRQWLERGQREVGRMALGCHGRVAIEAIQGDLGWSTFEAREARSKATYEGRLRLMDDERWPRRLFRYASLTGTQTQWCRRLGNLKRKFGMSAKPVVEDRMQKWAHAVKTQVCEEETEQWRRAMENKSTLLTYRTHKAGIGTEPLFDSSADVDRAICRICGVEEETTEHPVLHCTGLRPDHVEGTTFPLALGFRKDNTENRVVHRAVPNTKLRLVQWWRKTRRQCQRTDNVDVHTV
ncbi:hypothetical protein HPB50_018362 [Hyalomma asiaticum]|uniref:Uncharacterized protein n=1 Tax=Hyalomma asiaticum TaxID=266040 RepID=A0ACB7TR24_HYAAI|nr:hypothetical protein HPB50_018362 [Hyalomma asiaticum]